MCSQTRIILPLTAWPHRTTSCRLSLCTARHVLRSVRTSAASEAAPLLEWMQQEGCTVHGVELVYESSAGRLSRELRATQVSSECQPDQHQEALSLCQSATTPKPIPAVTHKQNRTKLVNVSTCIISRQCCLSSIYSSAALGPAHAILCCCSGCFLQ